MLRISQTFQSTVSFESILEDNREGTDIFCTICTGAFAIILFIICIAGLNVGNHYLTAENLRKMTYTVDGEENLCGYDLPEYPLLYYTSLDDPVILILYQQKRLCVAQCPKEGDTSLQCNPTDSLSCEANDNPKYEVKIYDTVVEHSNLLLIKIEWDCSASLQMRRKEIKFTICLKSTRKTSS